MDWQVLKATLALRHGGVIANATEAVIGLAAKASGRAAGQRIRILKRRPLAKPFIVVAANLKQLARMVKFDTPLREQIFASWPGPHTWVLPAAAGAPRWLVG